MQLLQFDGRISQHRQQPVPQRVGGHGLHLQVPAPVACFDMQSFGEAGGPDPFAQPGQRRALIPGLLLALAGAQQRRQRATGAGTPTPAVTTETSATAAGAIWV